LVKKVIQKILTVVLPLAEVQCLLLTVAKLSYSPPFTFWIYDFRFKILDYGWIKTKQNTLEFAAPGAAGVVSTMPDLTP